ELGSFTLWIGTRFRIGAPGPNFWQVWWLLCLLGQVRTRGQNLRGARAIRPSRGGARGIPNRRRDLPEGRAVRGAGHDGWLLRHNDDPTPTLVNQVDGALLVCLDVPDIHHAIASAGDQRLPVGQDGQRPPG